MQDYALYKIREKAFRFGGGSDMSHLVPVDDDDEIQQGDIIRRSPQSPKESPTWGFILTADCDIWQKKACDQFTWLEIITGADYLERHWAPEQLRRQAEKLEKTVIEGINGHLKRSENHLAPIVPRSLHDWLIGSTGEDVVKALNCAAQTKLADQLNVLRMALGHSGSECHMVRLRAVWTRLGQNDAAQQTRIKDALNMSQGFPDSLLIPEIPDSSVYGYMVLLRSISTLTAGNLFRSELDARINGRSDAYYRIGRFSDGVRFAIAQKLAFLFSRIGMPTEFEDACNCATDLLIETAFATNLEGR